MGFYLIQNLCLQFLGKDQNQSCLIYNDSNSLKEYIDIAFNQGHKNDDFTALKIT